MKNKLFFLIFLLTTILANSQADCAYKIIVDTDEESFKLTQEQLMEFILTPNESVFIYFSLLREADISSLVLQVSVNAKVMPPIMCFDKKSRLSFKMADGSFVSLPYLDDVNCGRQTEYEDQLDNSISEAAFYMDTVNMERLKSVQIESMRITSMKTHFDIEFQTVLSNPEIEVPIYPKEYFINTLGCIE